MFNRKIYQFSVRSIDALSVCRKYAINRDKIIQGLIQESVNKSKITSTKEWLNVRQTILNHELNRNYYTPKNIDASILGFCSSVKEYELGFSYIQFLKDENIRPNIATIGKYFTLLYNSQEKQYFIDKENGSVDEENILKCYQELRTSYPILDSLTLESVILGFSITSKWKKCLEFLEEIKITTIPNHMSYSATVAAAFLNNEEELGWKLLEDMIEHDRIPNNIVFLTYLSNIKNIKEDNLYVEKLERLFTFFQEKDYKCSEEVAIFLYKLNETSNTRKSFTQVSYNGVCKNCHLKLNKFEVSQQEFDYLKHKLLKNVIVGKDIFIKTNPEELKRFHTFVNNMECYDVVLDGLNIAYSAGTKQPPQVLSAMLAAVVSYFVEQNKKVLVLGRIHMNRWPKQHWEYIKRTCGVFLTQNISQDDPYLLYCALNSGKDTIIVTRDLMRSHKFLLKNPMDKVLFNRWLSQSQYQLLRVIEGGKPIFRIPPPFSPVAQKNEDIWHIPYETGNQTDKNDFHKTWLCLKCR